MTGPRGLGWLAKLLVRGRDRRLLRAELEDAYERDRARGVALPRAVGRYIANVFGTSYSMVRAWRVPDVGFSWLDVKLGLRMLVKQPGLTIVAVFALAIGIPVGLAPGHLVDAVESPFPVPQGDRIRAVRLWDAARSEVGTVTSFEYAQWRTSLRAFEQLGAVRTASYNVEVDGAVGEPVPGAEMTASAFDILRVAPALGRVLRVEDERIGAPEVAVVGHDLWQARLGGDPGVIGRTIRIGGVPHTVVGVMPRGFRFPIFHQVWVPMRESAAPAPATGLPLVVLGRLADGASMAEAQRQATALGASMARSFPEAYEDLRPEVVHAAYLMVTIANGSIRAMPGFHLTQGLTLLMLIVACTNVGLLVYARTATRAPELAVRTALGASRARIVTQVFTECLVLAVLAAGAGLVIIDLLPGFLPARVTRFVPWWMDFGVTPKTVAWALGLAVFSAAAAGVLPALRLTGRVVQRNLQRSRAERTGVRFGGMATALVAADVAIAIAVVGFAMALTEYLRDVWDRQAESVGFPAEQYLSAELRLPWSVPTDDLGAADRERFAIHLADTQRRLVERLSAEPGVLGVAVADRLPRMEHPTRLFELEDDAAQPAHGYPVKVARVDPGFFDAFDKPVLTGRGFGSDDIDGSSNAVLVNTAFVSEVLKGRNPIGRRVRYAGRNGAPAGDWYQIVGVVGTLGLDIMATEEKAGLYHPLVPGETQPRLAIHLAGDPESFTPRLRTLAADVDPGAVITGTMALDRVFEGDWLFIGAIVLAGALLIGILVALAASAIYAMMSFAVAQRTREIGIRAALGAAPHSIVRTITGRAVMQLGIGMAIGVPIAVFLFTGFLGGPQDAADLVKLVPGILVVLGIGLLACTAPTLRALRIDPNEALRES